VQIFDLDDFHGRFSSQPAQPPLSPLRRAETKTGTKPIDEHHPECCDSGKLREIVASHLYARAASSRSLFIMLQPSNGGKAIDIPSPMAKLTSQIDQFREKVRWPTDTGVATATEPPPLRGALPSSKAMSKRFRPRCALRELSRLGTTIDTLPDDEILMALARKHRLTAYVASYLELAMRQRLPLATLDAELIAAARFEGVPLVGESG
jgi:hypothetical protein